MQREPPPPMMSAPMMMGRTRMMVAAAIGLGLLFLAVGAMVVDLGNQVIVSPTPEQTAANANLRVFIGPAIAHFGMFLFVVGLIGAALFLEEMDIFVRLFLLIVSFVALLLVLANSPTLFGI